MLSENQRKKLEKLAKVLDGGDIALLTQLDALEGRLEGLEGIVPALREAKDGDKGEKGEKGDRGEKGDKGDNGKDGKDGKNGKDGKPGKDGKAGKNGRDGRDGVDGKDGVDGEMGMVDDATIAYLEEEIKRVEKAIPAVVRQRETNFGMVVRAVTAGRNMSVDSTDPNRPVITNTNPKITVSATPPTDPVLGDIWIDTDAYAYKSVSSTYAITSDDYFLGCSGTFTITLPTAVSFTGEYIIKNVGEGLITVATTSLQTIDGVTTFQLIPDEVIALRSTNSNWLIV